MKKFFIVLVAVILAIPAFCQMRNDVNESGRFTIRPTVGIGFTSFTGDISGNDMVVRPNFGVTVDWTAMKESRGTYWGLRSGLNLVGRGTKFSQSGGGEILGTKVSFDFEETYSPYYLEIPIMAWYQLLSSESWNLSIVAGAYFDCGVFGKNKFKGNASVGNIPDENVDVFDYIKRFDCGIRYGMEVTVKDRYVIGLTQDWGLTRIDKGGNKTKNETVANIYIGYNFVL